MTRIHSILVGLLLWMAVPCGASAQEYKAQDDSGKVSSYAVYDALRTESYQRHQARELEHFREKERLDLEASRRFNPIRLAALKELRAKNWEKYIEWLDAKALDDFSLQMKLEEAVPALTEYVKKSREITAERKLVSDSIAAEIRLKDNNAKAVYDKELKLLKAAYDKLPANKR